ncbi:MAG: 5'-methylthioadenosine/S-adenosylhomocysteine nucleosidase [Anaerolineae bacterium]|nr:5'-methylthioadenosine/S-adenosylhomocysteine nucleosidase [Anaerolineae bacterium]
MRSEENIACAVIISANSEWQIAKQFFALTATQRYPYGEWFSIYVDSQPTLFVQGGWGKVSAAASAQYVIDHWQPEVMINLGTCGGLGGSISQGEIILASETLIYDIEEKMGDPQEAIDAYTTKFDLSWLPAHLLQTVHTTRLVSADRDIAPQEVNMLREKFGAIAADWESGAIAWVAHRNHLPCLILRGASDLVNEMRGEAYGQPEVFQEGAKQVMQDLLQRLPKWLAIIRVHRPPAYTPPT